LSAWLATRGSGGTTPTRFLILAVDIPRGVQRMISTHTTTLKISTRIGLVSKRGRRSIGSTLIIRIRQTPEYYGKFYYYDSRQDASCPYAKPWSKVAKENQKMQNAVREEYDVIVRVS